MKTTTQIIAKEGYKAILIMLLALILALLLHAKVLSILFAILLVVLIYFYRNVERISDNVDSYCILAPLDGVVKNIENKDDGIYLSINKPICFCGLLRIPFAKLGANTEVKQISYVNGLKNGDEILGERVEISFMHENKKEIILKLYPKYISQITLYLQEKSGFKLAERFGFFLNGNAVLRIPKEAQLKIAVGDRILAAKSLLATLES